jgi:hypothetical protein
LACNSSACSSLLFFRCFDFHLFEAGFEAGSSLSILAFGIYGDDFVEKFLSGLEIIVLHEDVEFDAQDFLLFLAIDLVNRDERIDEGECFVSLSSFHGRLESGLQAKHGLCLVLLRSEAGDIFRVVLDDFFFGLHIV